jgi:anti-sigma factor RsiW
MKCTEIKPYLFDFVVDEVDPDIEIRIHEHLTECTECRVTVQEIEADSARLQSPTWFAPDPSVYRRIRDALPRKRKQRIFSWLPVSAGYALAAFLLGAVIMHTADNLLLRERATEKEVRYEPPSKMPYADTVEFYTVPVKNLARS